MPKTLANKPWNLTHDEVIDEVRNVGGLSDAMMGNLHYGHIRDKKLAACFRAVYENCQKAQAILSKANAKRDGDDRLLIGIRIDGRIIA